MAKTSGAKKPASSDRTKPVSPAQAFIGLHRIVTRKLLFEELPKEGAPVGQPGTQQQLQMQISVTLEPPHVVVTLTVNVKGEPSTRPYALLVELAGEFVALSASPEELLQFGKIVAPTIMFPYVRQLIHQVTADGAYGPLTLQLVNMQAFLAQSEWTGSGTGTAAEAAEPTRA